MLTNRQLFLRHLGQTSPSPLMIEIEKAKGVYLYSPTGEKYIDLISGVSVSNIGHSHPDVVRAIRKQAGSHLHLMVYGEIIQSPQVRYAGRLSELLPEALDVCYFVNSGSEAVEGALKLSKRYTGRSEILYFENAYHGSTHGAMSIQGREKYRNAFRPLLPGTRCLRFNSFEDLSSISKKSACVIIEPVQAEAGVIYPIEGYLKELRKRCSETGTLLIFDEAQTGFGRLGSLFATNLFGITPDILVLAKALGGGMPLGAFISSNQIMSSLMSNPELGHITTFGGHPVCCAAGLASLEVIVNENLSEQCSEKAKIFRKRLSHSLIAEIRGDGLLLAVKLEKPEYVRYVVMHAPEHGLVLDYFLFCEDSFRIAPPLTISSKEIVSACHKIKQLLNDANKNY